MGHLGEGLGVGDTGRKVDTTRNNKLLAGFYDSRPFLWVIIEFSDFQ